MAIDLKTISQLRDQTGAGIADCKKALEEADGDIVKAVEVLRKRGEIKAAKKSDRATKEGVIALAKADNKIAAVAVACETDFVAKNEDFVSTVNDFATKLLTMNKEEFKSWAEGVIKNELVVKIGENLILAESAVVEGSVLGSYLHFNKKAAAIVSLDGGSQELANDIAMHATAMSPKWIRPEEVPVEIVEKEKEIYRELLKQEGKPEQIWDKILVGKLAKFYEDNCLLNQIFVKDDTKKISDLLNGADIKEYIKFQI
ncbi:MAG: translation elongation factor Ts [Candidatus Buchananbacteria bacterium]